MSTSDTQSAQICVLLPSYTISNTMHTSNTGAFRFMDLPAELRIEIYRYSLVSGVHWVPRKRLPDLHSLRYRYNKRPLLFRERCDDSSIIFCKDYACRHRLMQHGHAIEAIQASDFAFGLFLSNKDVSHEAFRVFFGETHFVFENRLDLHTFLRTNKHAEFMKSLTFNMRKSHGTHKRQVKARIATWKLQLGCSWVPSVSDSMCELNRVCPDLAYMELIDDRRCNSLQDSIDLQTRGYIDWKEVKFIRRMGLQGFSYLRPDDERYKAVAAAGLIIRAVCVVSVSFFDQPLQQQNVLREATEAYIRNGIESR
jgi:hypothetical protein